MGIERLGTLHSAPQITKRLWIIYYLNGIMKTKLIKNIGQDRLGYAAHTNTHVFSGLTQVDFLHK